MSKMSHSDVEISVDEPCHRGRLTTSAGWSQPTYVCRNNRKKIPACPMDVPLHHLCPGDASLTFKHECVESWYWCVCAFLWFSSLRAEESMEMVIKSQRKVCGRLTATHRVDMDRMVFWRKQKVFIFQRIITIQSPHSMPVIAFRENPLSRHTENQQNETSS